MRVIMSKSLVVIAMSALVLTGCAAEQARQAARQAAEEEAKVRVAEIARARDAVNTMTDKQISAMSDEDACHTADTCAACQSTPRSRANCGVGISSAMTGAWSGAAIKHGRSCRRKDRLRRRTAPLKNWATLLQGPSYNRRTTPFTTR